MPTSIFIWKSPFLTSPLDTPKLAPAYDGFDGIIAF